MKEIKGIFKIDKETQEIVLKNERYFINQIWKGPYSNIYSLNTDNGHMLAIAKHDDETYLDDKITARIA